MGLVRPIHWEEMPFPPTRHIGTIYKCVGVHCVMSFIGIFFMLAFPYVTYTNRYLCSGDVRSVHTFNIIPDCEGRTSACLPCLIQRPCNNYLDVGLIFIAE